jgi:two-component system cell cycle sensor histidine kinase/response regulator CckA
LGDERALRESEERYRIVTEISRDAIEVINDAGDNIFVNPAVEELFGYTPEECHARKFRDWMDVVHPDDRDRVAEEYRHVEKRSETVHYEPMRIRHKDGRWVWIKSIATSYLSASGDRYILEVSQNITEQVEAEQRKQKLVEQRKEAQRLESLGVLAGGIAHDFNNILVAVLGNSDLALHKLSPLSPIRPLIERVMKAGKRAADLCGQMLAYSGKRTLAVSAIDLNEVVEEMSELLKTSLSKKVVLKYELAANLPVIEVDAAQLPQIVMNLIVNASEAIGENRGVIGVSTGVMECDSDFRQRSFFPGEEFAEGDYVYFEVSDTGCGIDEETKGKIFDPFFTTKFTGRGLGLATVLGIVRAHKGAIELYSEPDKGTTIKVLFPAIQQPAEPLARQTSAPRDWRGNGTILLVDDEEPVLDVGGMMLENAGFKVRTATDGREALEVFHQYQGDIVCVVLDLMMPNMDGEETLRELRRIQEDVKVVLSSGYHEQDVTKRLAETDFAGFLKKPYTSDTLIGQLRQVLEENG